MAQEEIKYTIPSQGSGANNGKDVDVIVTYDPTAQNADGSYTITDASGTYSVLNDDGTVNHTDNITGINGAGQFSATDNKIFIVNDPTTSQIVDDDGISFTIDNDADSDSATNNNGNVNFYNNGSPTSPEYIQYNSNSPSATSVSEAPAPCFASGTSIRTLRGEVAVEYLTTDDAIINVSGSARSISWLGHRRVDCRNHARPSENLPIRISAHAFGDNRPLRDLFVSPGHAICVDVLGEVLIPAGLLVNGSTVQQIDVDEVTYWHVELDSHDVILAENLPAETYLDMGNRGFFAEGTVVALTAAPDADPSRRTHADFCRPFVDGGPILEAVRLLLRQRAEAIGWRSTDALEMHLVVDGQQLDPVVRGLTARFHLPAGAKNVWLVSPTAQPRDTLGGTDTRDLGLYIGALRIDDGFATRDIAIDDPLLCIGFHAVEDGARRWTSGRARLPAALWDGCESGFYLRIDLAGRPVPRWTEPAVEPVSIQRPTRVVAA